MCRVLNCQGSEYFRNAKMSGFWISRVLQGLPVFLNMTGFWLCQDSEYAKFKHTQALHKFLHMPEYGWIICLNCLWNMAGLWICLVKVSLGFEHAPVLSMPGLFFQVCEYARITQGCKYAWICLNNASICVNMLKWCWICLNMPEYTWINRVLNIPEFWM